MLSGMWKTVKKIAGETAKNFKEKITQKLEKKNTKTEEEKAKERERERKARKQESRKTDKERKKEKNKAWNKKKEEEQKRERQIKEMKRLLRRKQGKRIVYGGRSNKVKIKRLKRIRKRWSRWVRPLDWHKRRRKNNVWKQIRLRSKHKETIRHKFWRLRYHETVVWELKRLSVERKLKRLEDKVAVILNLPMEVESFHSTTNTDDPVLDSGAMCHSGDASKDEEARRSRQELKEQLTVKGVTDGSKEVTHDYTMRVPSAVKGQDIALSKALDIPGTSHNLVAVGLLDDQGLTTTFKNGEGRVTDDDGKLIMYAKKLDGLYRLKATLVEQLPQHVVNYNSESLKRAHDIMGHRAFDVIRKMLNLPRESKECMNPVCSACAYAQMRDKKGNVEALTRAPRFGFRLHSDTSRKMPAAKLPGQSGVQRYLLTGDEFSDTLFVDFGARKSDAKRQVVSRIDKINSQRAPEIVAEHQTDGGTEFVNKWLDKQLLVRGVTPRNSTPYCQYQNGWIESRMEEIDVSSRAMMFRGNAPKQDWTYAVRHAVFLHDIMPNPITGVTPHEKRTGIQPRIKPKNLRGTLFCKCYAKVYKRGVLERAAVPCIYLGKDDRTPGVLVRKIGGKNTGKEVMSAVVVSYESDEFPYAEQSVPVPDAIRAVNYASDSEPEENGIVVNDGEEMGYSDEGDSDSEDAETDEEEDTLRSKMRVLNEPNIAEERQDEEPDGVIGGDDAWEIEEIVAEKIEKKGRGRGSKYYQVKWKGDFPLDWLHCSRVRAPEIVRQWNEKKRELEAAKPVVQSLVMRVCQLNNDVEVKPEKLEEVNPFKKLFDPRYDKRVNPPRGYQSMLKHIFAEQFQQALIREKLENKKWNTYVEVPRSQVPAGMKILKPVTAYDIKYNTKGEIEKFKSRVCLDGSRTTVDASETYECIASTGTIRLLLCMAARYGLGIAQTDVKNFFLQAVLPEEKEYYAEIPDGWAENDPKTHVAKVLAPWYGLKEAAKLAGDQLAAILKKAGLKENPWMPKVFFKWDGDDFVACANHIDDAVWIYTSRKLLDQVLDEVDKSFVMTRTYDVKKLLGFEIEYDKVRGLMKLHQGPYHRAKLLEIGHKNPKPANSPGHIPAKIENPVFPIAPPQATPDQVRLYQKKVGIQMWGLQTDPSSMFVVHRLASKMLNPQKNDWEEMSRVERYKATHPEMGVVFRRAKSKEKLKRGTSLDCLTYYADADLAGDKSDAKSTSGYCVHLGESGMFDWKSKKQTCVCQSSCESEVYSSKECTCHAIWLRQGLSYMSFKFTGPTPVCQDNTGAIALCKSDKHHSRTRHFRMHVNLLKDNLQKRVTRYPWIPTKFMKGDLFNKAHGPSKHQELCELNGVYSQKVSLVSDKVPELRIDGWAETVKEQKAQENAVKDAGATKNSRQVTA